MTDLRQKQYRRELRLKGEEKRRQAALVVAFRAGKRWTQVQLAEALGMDKRTITQWESGDYALSPQNLLALSALWHNLGPWPATGETVQVTAMHPADAILEQAGVPQRKGASKLPRRRRRADIGKWRGGRKSTLKRYYITDERET